MNHHACPHLRSGEECKPHQRIPVWKRIAFSTFGVLLVVWWPVANRLQAGATIEQVETVLFGTGLLFLVSGIGSVILTSSMHEDHEFKYFLSGAGLPGVTIALAYLPQVI
jgi:hypothetical protein